jgi:hypothetical protein
MTKERFYGLCQASSRPLSLTVGRTVYDANLAVRLHGGWGGDSYHETPVYTPHPGRQGTNARELCHRQLPKFQRWLAEWQVRQKSE